MFDLFFLSLLVCSLWLVQAQVSIVGRLDASLSLCVMRILDHFASSWSAQEDRRRMKEAEESALYKYKEQTHGDERSDQEREEEEFRQAYPTFEKVSPCSENSC